MLPLKRQSCSHCTGHCLGTDNWFPLGMLCLAVLEIVSMSCKDTVLQMFASLLFGACIMHFHRNQSRWDFRVPRTDQLIRLHLKYLIVCTIEIRVTLSLKYVFFKHSNLGCLECGSNLRARDSPSLYQMCFPGLEITIPQDLGENKAQ